MTYTYRFATLLSDSDLTELELSNVKFDRRIIVPGSFSGSIVVANEDIAKEVRKVIPAKTVVHVYKGADIWGTYIIWQVRVKSNSTAGATVEFIGASLESWFYRRLVDSNVDFIQTDQIEIMRTLVSNAQYGWTPYQLSADLNIVAQNGFSGVLRDRHYKLTEAVSVGQRIEELANVDDGFEYMIRTYVNDFGERIRELAWGYPRLNQSVKNVKFFYPGNILSYEVSYDTTDAATAFWARGDSIEEDGTEDSEPLMTPIPKLAVDYLVAGWPHIDKVVDYPSVVQLSTLEAYANWWSSNHAGMVMIPALEVRPEEHGTFTPNELGAVAEFAILDLYFPLTNGSPSFTGNFRIVGMEVTPSERGKGEVVRFIIETEFDPTDTIESVANGNA